MRVEASRLHPPPGRVTVPPAPDDGNARASWKRCRRRRLGGCAKRPRARMVARSGSGGASAVRADRRRTVSCHVRRMADFGSFMPILLVGVRWRWAIGWVCKPEVAGSSPARSIKYLQIALFCCPQGRNSGETTCPRLGLTPRNPARSRKFPQVVLPADQTGGHLVCRRGQSCLQGFPGRQQRHPAHIPRQNHGRRSSLSGLSPQRLACS